MDLVVIVIKWFQVDQKLEFPRNRLMLDETIGEGEFGRVSLMFYILYLGMIYVKTYPSLKPDIMVLFQIYKTTTLSSKPLIEIRSIENNKF